MRGLYDDDDNAFAPGLRGVSDDAIKAIRGFHLLTMRVDNNTRAAEALVDKTLNAPESVKAQARAALAEARAAFKSWKKLHAKLWDSVKTAFNDGKLSPAEVDTLRPTFGLGVIPIIALGVAAVLAAIGAAAIVAAYRTTSEDAARAEAVTATAAAGLEDWKRRSAASGTPVAAPVIPGRPSMASSFTGAGISVGALVAAGVLAFFLLRGRAKQ